MRKFDIKYLYFLQNERYQGMSIKHFGLIVMGDTVNYFKIGIL